MFKRFKISIRMTGLIIIVSLLLFFGIVSFTYNEDRELNSVEKFVRDSVVSIQEFIYMPFNFIIDSFNNFREVIQLYDEYGTLKAQLDKHAMIVAQKEELEAEIASLKKILDINTIMTDYKIQNATVVFRNVDGWHNTLTIDRGNYHGVKKDMAVITNEGVIGRITKVNELTSEVKLLTSQSINSKVSALIQTETGDVNGLIESYDPITNLFLFKSVEAQSEVKSGDLVVTSGYGDVFPRGILLGTVVSVEKDQFDLSQIVQIKPSADFTDIRYVSLIESVKNEK